MGAALAALLMTCAAAQTQKASVPPNTFKIRANPEQISGVRTRLRDIGVLVAVDDFGTGYSSLAYLRRLPIEVLKIDRSFVMNADRDEGDAQVVKLVVALGRALKLEIVAEGVETESQAEFLRSCGCNIAQGYLYARPQPATPIEVWLREHCDEANAAQSLRPLGFLGRCDTGAFARLVAELEAGQRTIPADISTGRIADRSPPAFARCSIDPCC